MQIDDLSGVQPTSFDVVPAGTYTVVITEAEEKTASTGTAGIGVTFEIVTGEHKGRYLWDSLWLSPKALGRFRGSLEAAGVVIPAGRFNFTPESLIGKVLKVVTRVKPADPVNGYDARAEVKAWKAAEAGAQASQPGPYETRGPAGAAADDDDIPF